MKSKEEPEISADHQKSSPFEVVAAHCFDSGTFVFPEAERRDIPYVVLVDPGQRTILVSTPLK